MARQGPRTDELQAALQMAAHAADAYISGLASRPVRPGGAALVASLMPSEFPETGPGALPVLQELAGVADAAALASSGPRFFHWATGGVTPAALGADMLASAYDQSARFFASSPLAARAEELSLIWLKILCNLPTHWAGTLTSGATMANFVGLASARHWWGLRHQCNIDDTGMAGVPALRVFSSDRLHPSTRNALGMLGLGRQSVELLPRAPSGDVDLGFLDRALADVQAVGMTALVVATAGEVDTGQFDPIGDMATICRRRNAWLHIDAAFGLMASITPRAADLLQGIEGAHSVASAAHKWLNVPYDSGFVFVASKGHLEGAFRSNYAFLGEVGMDLSARSPENSRRARGLAIWATLKAYGRGGCRAMIEHYLELAQELAGMIERAPDLELLAPVPLNVVLFRHRPKYLADADLNGWNEMLGRRVMDKGRVYIGSMTRYNGCVGFRSVIMNWMSRSDDLRSILSSLAEAAEELS
jgi:glutamate/tyrosine decarboxylase-like PLP-dependent enzyme